VLWRERWDPLLTLPDVITSAHLKTFFISLLLGSVFCVFGSLWIWSHRALATVLQLVVMVLYTLFRTIRDIRRYNRNASLREEGDGDGMPTEGGIKRNTTRRKGVLIERRHCRRVRRDRLEELPRRRVPNPKDVGHPVGARRSLSFPLWTKPLCARGVGVGRHRCASGGRDHPHDSCVSLSLSLSLSLSV
jgi:hypothetical protein